MISAGIVIALSAATAPSQQQATPVFPSSAELVRVVVSVTDASGRPIRGLKRGDFTIRDDGRKREIATVAECDNVGRETPADCQAGLVLLLDTSRSMDVVLEHARDAAVAFSASVPEARTRSLISFESTVKVWPFDTEHLAATIDRIIDESVGNGTRLFEAVLKGTTSVAADPSPRPIIVAVTDGEDTEGSLRRRAAMQRWGRREFRENGQKIKGREPKEIAAELQKSAVAFYAVSFAHSLPGERRKHAEEALQTLAQASGGLIVDGTAKDLAPQFARIREDLSSQYVLGFAPASSQGAALHRLKIEVKDRTARVRHREAYAARPAAR